MNRLGQILCERGLISNEQLEYILTIQNNNGSRLGDIIISEGIISYLELYKALAEHYGLEFVNLLDNPPDEILLSHININDYIRLRSIPWKLSNGTMIIATSEFSNETRKWVINKFGKNTQLVITSPLDIRKTIERIYGNIMEEDSKLNLWLQNPESSARVTASVTTQNIVSFLMVCVLESLLIFPMESSRIIILFCSVSYFISMLVKMLIFCKGCHAAPKIKWTNVLARLDDSSLPVYTILIPMYKEVASLPNMLHAMKNMEYPAEKMDIKLVLESDDHETINAALAFKPSHNFEIIRVPHSTLRTKPKACNYALKFAKGEYITVFDADDIPDPQQLKKAIATFRSLPDDIICLQARLNYYNGNDNWLTRFFSLEYISLFDAMLHGLERLDIPLPLGGTSNHISLIHLRELGEWDAYNVTEDADLGIRLAARGFRTAMLDSCTLEESPLEVSAWIRQRSRWIKGYMQTWLVHMRNPFSLYRSLGLRSFLGFQFFVGFSNFTFLTAPLLWCLVLLWWILPRDLAMAWLPEWLLWLSLDNLMLNFVIHWVMMIYCISIGKKSGTRYKISAVLYPFYLFLHSIASYKALYQLIVKPHFWEKTMHGFSPQSKNNAHSINSATNLVDCPAFVRV